MTFLPIVARELRVASRRYMTYWSRAIMAAFTILVGVVVYINVFTEPPASVGMDLFRVLCCVAFIYCLITGITATADSLSEERREGTLGLLFLTDLKGYDVVFGKLAASSMRSFFGLIAILPVLAIPLLMGGVTNAEFGRAALVLTNTCFLSLSSGMFMSSLCVSPRKAMAATLILMVVLVFGFPPCALWQLFVNSVPSDWKAMAIVNPVSAFSQMFDAGYKSAKEDFWASTGLLFGFSGVFLTLASLIVPRSWQDKTPGAKRQRWSVNWSQWSFGDSSERLVFRRRLLDINAFFWLAARRRLKPAYVWTALIILASLWTWGALAYGNDWLNFGVYFISIIILGTLLKIWLTSEAARRLGEDRQIGALELLLSTPLSIEDILRGQLLALKRQFFGPVIATLLAEAILLAASLRSIRGDNEEMTATVSLALGAMIMLVIDLFALIYVGMWASLTSKNPIRATGIALRRILLLPWVVIVLMAIFFSLSRDLSVYLTWKSFLGAYVVLGISVDLWYGIMAWNSLRNRFREVATQRFEFRRSFWNKLTGRGKQPAPQ